MASSRIFVRGLPPTITEADFRKHFSAKNREITDIKLLPHRRIGYVGYKTAEDANGAVKYFNRTFIRMSRVEVELAKSVSDPSLKPRWVHKGRVEGDAKQPQPSEKPQQPAAEPQDNQRKRKREVDENDPKLREYLQVMQQGTQASTADGIMATEVLAPTPEEDDSGDEYEELPAVKKSKHGQNEDARSSPKAPTAPLSGNVDDAVDEEESSAQDPPPPMKTAPPVPIAADDDEWLRSHTSRVLDLVDADDLSAAPIQPQAKNTSQPQSAAAVTHEDSVEAAVPSRADAQMEPQPMEVDGGGGEAEAEEPESSARLFIRNLPYSASEDELREHFASFGDVEEVHFAVAKDGSRKGFGFVLFSDATSADKARNALDGTIFQGRLLHIMAGKAKREQGLDEFALSKLPLKKQNLIRKKMEAATKSFNWNSLFMSQDAVNTSVADRLGISKSDMLDPTSADGAVKQALAETNIIQETKAYFAANGVDLNAFKSQKRGQNTILVKNFPYGTSMEELRTLFEAHGTVLKVLMPPSGTIAVVHFAQASHAKAAFAKLAYSRIRESVLYLEKGPAELFGKEGSGGVDINNSSSSSNNNNNNNKTNATQAETMGIKKLSISELLERNDDDEGDGAVETSSLFVRNLAFSTTTARLEQAFKSLDGFVSARVKTKTDPKRPGQVLSMGFGFVEFRTKEDAQAGLKVMDGHVLDGHTLGVKPSHKGHDAAEERRREDKAKRAAGKRTKIIIKNLPFEATKKDVRTLFGTYGQLRAVRVPRKFDKSRGFGFAEFTTPREAENALAALQDTHLLGRRLVLNYAETDAVDAEEEIAKMQRKVGAQVSKVALQQLTGRGRTKVTIDNGMDEQPEE